MSDSEITVEQMIDCMRALRAFAALNNQPHSATMYDAILSALSTHAELARDAARYRFLCSLGNAEWNRFGRVPDNELDAAIDSAMAEGGTK